MVDEIKAEKIHKILAILQNNDYQGVMECAIDNGWEYVDKVDMPPYFQTRTYLFGFVQGFITRITGVYPSELR